MWSNTWKLTMFSLPTFFMSALLNLIFGLPILSLFILDDAIKVIFQNLALILLFILPTLTKTAAFKSYSYNQNPFQKEFLFLKTFPFSMKEILFARTIQCIMMALLLGFILYPFLLWFLNALDLLEVALNRSLIITTTLMLVGYSFLFIGLSLFTEFVFYDFDVSESTFYLIGSLVFIVPFALLILIEFLISRPILSQTILLASKYGLFAGFVIFTIGGVSTLIWVKWAHHIMKHRIVNRARERR